MTPEPRTTSTRTDNRVLHYVLWVAQVVLALFFAMAGWAKLTSSYAELAANMAWVSTVPEWLVRFIGVAELAGALGLVLPAALRIKPVLTPVAAVGLFIIMVAAAGLHLMRGEPILLNVILGLVAAFVAWGRFSGAPIADRSRTRPPAGTVPPRAVGVT